MAEYDYKRIGRNIKYIRNAVGKNPYDFSALLGWSESKLAKIESANTPDGTINEQTLMEAIPILCRIGLCSATDLLWGDLSFLEKKSLVFDDSLDHTTFTEVLADVEWDILLKCLPVITTLTGNQSAIFNEGVDIYQERIITRKASAQEIEQAIQKFLSYSEETKDVVGIVNALSLFVYLWEYYIGSAVQYRASDNLLSTADYTETICIDEAKLELYRNTFFKKWNYKLTQLMRSVTESHIYSDFAYYYLCIRYLFGMLDRKITHLDQIQEAQFGRSLLDCLCAMGNKYAVALKDAINE